LILEKLYFMEFVYKLLVFRLLQNIGLRYCNKIYFLDFICKLPLSLNQQTQTNNLYLQFFMVNKQDKKQTHFFPSKI